MTRARDDLTELVASVPLGDGAKRRALDLLRGADRLYHGVDHVALLWGRHRAFAREAGFDGPHDDGLVASAILFHDCVYAADRRDSEQCSAEAWLQASAEAGLDADDRAWVADTILATRDHLGTAAEMCRHRRPDHPLALRLWMLDLDLTPFGEPPDVFDRNVELLRAEAPHLDDATFETARLGLLRRFSDAEAIYRTPALAIRFDPPARLNLARHLASSTPRTRRMLSGHER